MYDDYTRQYGRDDRGRHGQQYTNAPEDRRVDPTKLWVGGVVTAVIAVLVAFVGLLIARGIFDIPVGAPDDVGVTGDVSTVGMCTIAAAAAIVATGVLHLMLIAMPRPEAFFAAIVFLVTLAFALQPFTVDGLETNTQVATMLVYMATGASIGVSLAAVAGNSR